MPEGTTGVATPPAPVKFTFITPLREATINANGDARVCIITTGLGNLRDRNYYTDEAITSCVSLFNGKQFFLDHPTETEESDRPERSVRDLAGYFYDTSVGTVRDPVTNETLKACFASLSFDESDAGRTARAKVAKAIEYQRKFHQRHAGQHGPRDPGSHLGRYRHAPRAWGPLLESLARDGADGGMEG